MHEINRQQNKLLSASRSLAREQLGQLRQGRLPKTGRPLLSETTIPVYPLVSNFLEHSNKSFSIISFLFQSELAVEVGLKKGRESERCAQKRQMPAMTAAQWRKKKDEE
jgi:hypothetical protein